MKKISKPSVKKVKTETTGQLKSRAPIRELIKLHGLMGFSEIAGISAPTAVKIAKTNARISKMIAEKLFNAFDINEEAVEKMNVGAKSISKPGPKSKTKVLELRDVLKGKKAAVKAKQVKPASKAKASKSKPKAIKANPVKAKAVKAKTAKKK